MKNKEQFDREITSFKETLKELREKYDVIGTTAKNRINVIIWNLEELEKELKKDVFLSFVEKKLDIKLSVDDKCYILGYTHTIKCPMIREDLLDCIRLAYNGEDVIFNDYTNSFRLIKVPRGHTYKYKGAYLPSGHLVETMNKLYGNNWRYVINEKADT